MTVAVSHWHRHRWQTGRRRNKLTVVAFVFLYRFVEVRRRIGPTRVDDGINTGIIHRADDICQIGLSSRMLRIIRAGSFQVLRVHVGGTSAEELQTIFDVGGILFAVQDFEDILDGRVVTE